MAFISSPRRILGECDANKPLSIKPSSASGSPSKATSYINHNVLEQKALHLGKWSEPLLSTTMLNTSPSPAPIRPLSGAKKRGAVCLDIQDEPPRKHTIISLRQEIDNGFLQGIGRSETRPFQDPEDECCVKAAVVEFKEYDGGSFYCSVSPDSSFDATQDSEILDSQITSITEPEDGAQAELPLPLLAIAPVTVPRVFSQEESRENAEALRLRLKVAMYKIKTNQTDLPLYKLQIRPSRTSPCARTLLPTSKLVSTPLHDKLAGSTSHHFPTRNDRARDPTSVQSSSSSPPSPMSPHRPVTLYHESRGGDLATPVLPRSRDGSSHFCKQGSPEPGPEVTSSVIKGRAADGLLSLMGCEGRHA